MKKITCFIPCGTQEETLKTVQELQKSELVSKIIVLRSQDQSCFIDGVEVANAADFLKMAQQADVTLFT